MLHFSSSPTRVAFLLVSHLCCISIIRGLDLKAPKSKVCTNSTYSDSSFQPLNYRATNTPCSPFVNQPGYREVLGRRKMALRQFLGWSNGELMRSDAKPCSTMMRQTAGIFSVCGALAFWTLGRVYYGPRITIPRTLRWGLCGAVSGGSGSALLVRLFLPECEPQNIAAYDKRAS